MNFYILDVDRCLSNPCHEKANCSNTESSYSCQCNQGYSGDGITCQGIEN